MFPIYIRSVRLQLYPVSCLLNRHTLANNIISITHHMCNGYFMYFLILEENLLNMHLFDKKCTL